MTATVSTRPRWGRPADPRARERLRAAQEAEARAVAAVYAAEARVEQASARLAETSELLGRARADVVAVSGLDRAAVLLGVGKTELRKALAGATSSDGAA